MKIINVVLFAYLALALPNAILAQDCSALTEITDVEILNVGSQLFVFWQEPTNLVSCGFNNVIHTVTYSGYGGVQEIVTADYYAFFEYAPYRCVPGIVTITITADDVESVTTIEDHYTETSSVENLSAEQNEDGAVVVSWSAPEDSEFCNFVYNVSYVDDSNSFTTTTTDLQTILDVILSSCNLATLTVTPYHVGEIAEYEGVSRSAEIEGEINAVRNYALSSSGGEVVANFDPPVGIENCEITYEVREIESDCYVKEVNVSAYNGRIYSEWVSDTIEVEINSVQDLEATVGEEAIIFTWTEPLSASACGVVYRIQANDLTFVASGSGASIPSSALANCVTTTVSINAVSSSGKVGVSAEIDVKPELRAVRNLSLSIEGNVVSASWDAPQNAETCVLSYLLEYKNESGIHWYVTDRTSYTFAYDSCVGISLNVLPHGEDGSEGISNTVALEADC